MSRIVWDDVGERRYESGVSHGVLYLQDGVGVPWNGITEVQVDNEVGAEGLYIDGFKYEDLITYGDFKGKLTAFTYPDEFLVYEGTDVWEEGFYLANQELRRFGLSYRTKISDDLDQNAGYKIHVVYNVLAIPATKTYETLSLSPEPSEFEWNITALPVEIDKFRPTAHVIIDTRKIDPYLLLDVENLLYGDSTNDAMLPDLRALVSFVQRWGRFIITDHGDGTWSAYSPIPGVITENAGDSFTIVTDTATYLDADTYEVSSDEELEV